jgi:hypothetical protein
MFVYYAQNTAIGVITLDCLNAIIVWFVTGAGVPFKGTPCSVSGDDKYWWTT